MENNLYGENLELEIIIFQSFYGDNYVSVYCCQPQIQGQRQHPKYQIWMVR